MSEDNMYIIERILDRKKIKNKLMYKIKWEGYPMDQCTWEPIENLKTAIEFVEEYNNIHPLTQTKTTKNNKTKKNIMPKDTFIGTKRKPTKNGKQENSKIIETKIEGGQEKEKQEKINNFQEENQEQYTIIRQKEYCKKFKIDDSLLSVRTVRKKENKLIAEVEKLKENGETEKVEIETSRLKTENPWILLDFYESKIKFT